MKLILIAVLFLQIPIIVWAQDQKGAKKGESDRELFIEIYAVPPVFKNQVFPGDPPASGNLPRRRTAKIILESVGIDFSKGTSANYNLATSTVTVINTEDQLELVDAYLEGCNITPRSIHIILEYIETDSSRFHDWMFENRITTDGTPFRKEVQEWVKDGKATIIETVIVNARSGQRVKTESVQEVIYPIEWDPPEIPNEVKLSGENTVSPMSAAVGMAHEMRKVGSTFEVDPVLGADRLTIDLNLAPEIVQKKETINWPADMNSLPDSLPMPVLHKLKITTQVTTLHRRYSFLGAAPPLKAADPDRKKPIVLVFVRGDIIESPEEPRKRYRRRYSK